VVDRRKRFGWRNVLPSTVRVGSIKYLLRHADNSGHHRLVLAINQILGQCGHNIYSPDGGTLRVALLKSNGKSVLLLPMVDNLFSISAKATALDLTEFKGISLTRLNRHSVC